MPYYRRGIAGCQPPVRNFAESSRGARFLTARSGFSYKVFRKFSAPLPGLLRKPTKAETAAELRIRQAPGQEKPLHRRFTAGAGASERGVRKIYRHAAPDAAEWLVCRFGTPPGRAVSLWGLSERMAFSLESAGGAAAPLSTADKKSIYPNSEIPMKKM